MPVHFLPRPAWGADSRPGPRVVPEARLAPDHQRIIRLWRPV